MQKTTLLQIALVAAVFAAGFIIGQVQSNAAQNRVFELRTYTTHPGKLPDLMARFRNHTTKLFEKHGMTNVGYWVPADGPKKDNTLIYVLAHPSQEAAKKAWDGFRADAAWLKARDESEKNGKIVEKVEFVYMDPADFSKIK
jgi:hypothetical protein